MGRTVLAYAAIALAGPGCGEDLESAPLPDLDQAEVGERCASRRDSCRDDGNILRCEDGHWALWDCAWQCSDAEWFGCLMYDDSAFCECGERIDPSLPSAPMPPHYACLDAQTLQICEYESDCVAYDCETLCTDAGRTASGCFETVEGGACHCTFAGTECYGGVAPRCDGLTALATCVDGIWLLVPCTTDCSGTMQPGCRLADDGTSACTCVEA